MLNGRILTFLRSHILLSGVVLIGAFFVVVELLPNHDVIEFLRILQASVSVAVIVAYVPWAWKAVTSALPDRVDQLTMGITLGFFAVLGQGIWLLLWRLGGKPEWMLDSVIAALWIWLSILAGVLHITAPGAINGQIPRRNIVWLGTACGAGVALFLIVTWLQPNVSPVVWWIFTILDPET